METPKIVKIACVGHATAGLDDFVPFQGELKRLSEADFEALRAQITEGGFSFALHVWESEGKKYLIDGHQRVITLRRMREAGWEVPALPYSLVYADSYEQAKLKLLAAASQYGKTSDIGLAAFLKDIQIDPIKLASEFPLPAINMPKFIEVHFPASAEAPVDEGDVGEAPSVTTGPAPVAGSAGNTSEMPVSQVRMVQLFFNNESHVEFMAMLSKLQEKFQTDNLTDTVFEAVKAAHEGA